MSESDPALPEADHCPALPDSFEDLAASRRHWIDAVLHPWCRKATLKQLRRLEPEWTDMAGRVDINATLWTWAWERFPGLTHPEMAGVNETHQVQLTLTDGTIVTGFPDSRLSVRGTLVIVGNGQEYGPYPIDDVVAVDVLAPPQ